MNTQVRLYLRKWIQTPYESFWFDEYDGETMDIEESKSIIQQIASRPGADVVLVRWEIQDLEGNTLSEGEAE